MNRKTLSVVRRATILFSILVALQPAAFAGPTLICWPFDIGTAKSLPFGGPKWSSIKADYDRGNLVYDTLQLLGRETPIIVRMETIRRATVYITKDPRLAKELLGRLNARANEAASTGSNEALAALDLGYLIECCRQAHWMIKDPSLLAGLDGYAWIKKAIRLRGNDPQFEFAAAMVTIDRPEKHEFADHRARALAGAAEGSLLGRNLIRHAHLLRLHGGSLAELRSQAGMARK